MDTLENYKELFIKLNDTPGDEPVPFSEVEFYAQQIFNLEDELEPWQDCEDMALALYEQS